MNLALLLLLLLAAAAAAAATVEQKRILKVATLEVEGFSMLDSSGHWFGLVPDLVKAIGVDLGFEPNFTRIQDGRFGYYEESTGNWSGLIGEVVTGRVHFAAAPLTVTSLREEHVDFSQEFLDTGLAVLAKKPGWANPVTRSAAFFLGVFDVGVWSAAVLVFLTTSLLVFLNDRYNPREYRARQAEHNSRNASLGQELLMQTNDFSMFGSLFYVISTGCFQGYRKAPQSLVGRSLSVFWWIFSAAFAAAYVASLVCAMVASRGGLERHFPLLEVLDPETSDTFSGFVPAWIVNGSTHAFFKGSQDPVFQMIYKQYTDGAKANPELAGLKTMEDLVSLITSDAKYFGVVESVMADYYSRASNCALLNVGSLLNDRSYALAFPHGSNLTRQVNEVLLRLRESGFVQNSYRRHFLHNAAQCSQALPFDATVAMSLAGEGMARMFRDSLPVTLHSFSGPILLYFVSLLLSGTAGLADIYIFTRYERYRQGSQPFQGHQPEQHEQEPEPSFGALTFSDDQRLASPT